MASRKRPRENDLSDADLEQKDITLEELPPVKKKTIITDGDPILEQEIRTYWQQIWAKGNVDYFIFFALNFSWSHSVAHEDANIAMMGDFNQINIS